MSKCCTVLPLGTQSRWPRESFAGRGTFKATAPCAGSPWPRPPARWPTPRFRPRSTAPPCSPGTTSRQTAAGELAEAETDGAAQRGGEDTWSLTWELRRTAARSLTLTHPHFFTRLANSFDPACQEGESGCEIRTVWTGLQRFFLSPGSWSCSPVTSKVSGPRLRSCSHTGDTELSLEPNTLATS